MSLAPFQSCIACHAGDTVTGIAFTGTSAWVVAMICTVCGLREEAAVRVALEAAVDFAGPPGELPAGVRTYIVRICESCAEAGRVSVGRLVDGELATYVEGAAI